MATLFAACATLCVHAQLKPETDLGRTAQPRSWDDEKSLCAQAFLTDFNQSTRPELTATLLLPAYLLLRDGLPEEMGKALGEQVAAAAQAARVLDLSTLDDTAVLSLAQASFLRGEPGEVLLALRGEAFRRIDCASSNEIGDVVRLARFVVRAARLTGHLGLRQRALESVRGLADVRSRIEVTKARDSPFEILNEFAPDAIAACCDAYQLSDDRAFVEQALRWAQAAGYSDSSDPDAAAQNALCGQDLSAVAAMLDLSEYDGSRPWGEIARGVLAYSISSQLTGGDLRGFVPGDSSALFDIPRSLDRPPTEIVLNECRLRGNSGEVRTRRVPGRVGESLINSAFNVPAVLGQVGEGTLAFTLIGKPGASGFSVVAPAPEPKEVEGGNERSRDSSALDNSESGWLYQRDLQALIIKSTIAVGELRILIRW